MTVLQIEDQPLVKISYTDGILQFSALLFDEDGNKIAKLDQNEWWADTNHVWDITYKANNLKIWHQERQVGLR